MFPVIRRAADRTGESVGDGKEVADVESVVPSGNSSTVTVEELIAPRLVESREYEDDSSLPPPNPVAACRAGARWGIRFVVDERVKEDEVETIIQHSMPMQTRERFIDEAGFVFILI